MRKSVVSTRASTARAVVSLPSCPLPTCGRFDHHHKLTPATCASVPTWSTLCRFPSRSGTRKTAGPVAASSTATSGQVLNDEHVEEDEGEDEAVTPPLPTATLEVLSEILTGLAMRSMESGEGVSSMSFCVNCCRPVPPPNAGAEARVCSSCGHHPSRDAEILGEPHAWVAAYEEQLKRQQETDKQLGQRDGQEGQPAQHIAAGGAQAGDVLLVSDPRMLLHRSSLPPYPGRPERLQAIMSRLHSSGLMARCRLLPCRPAADPELTAVHSRELVAAVRAMGARGAEGAGAPEGCECGKEGTEGHGHHHSGSGDHGSLVKAASGAASTASASGCCSSLCADTLYNAHTGTAALLAAGAAADVGAALAAGRAARALAVVRPPGAQAGVDLARGGCYLNNVAVAAAAALGAGARRVMVVDWDVHHGRGTAEIFADDPRVMVVDMHRYDRDIYPGSGAVEEVGEGEGEGSTLNLAFASPGLTDGDLLSAGLHVLLPVAHQFRPDVVLVVAGFGALRGDPIGGCDCSPAVFAQLTHLLSGVAPRGLGLLLEGGYNLSATAAATEACLRVLLGEAPPPLPGPWATTSAGWVGIMNAMQVHSQYWSALHPLSFNGWIAAVNEQQRQLQEAEAQGQQQQERQQLAHEAGPASGSFGEAGGGVAGLLEDEEESDHDGLLALEGEAGGEDEDDELPLQELMEAAAALRRGVRGGSGGGLGAAEAGRRGEASADPDPAEVLDFILGTGGNGASDSRGPGGHSVSSLSVEDEGSLGGDNVQRGIQHT